MRTRNGNAVRSWQQYESNLPKGGNIEPTSVGVEKNDTELEGFEAFKVLVELSGIDKPIEEIYKEINAEELTGANGERVWLINGTKATAYDLMYAFLNKYYAGKYAYIKRGEHIIYGQVDLQSRSYKMRTSKGIIKMPSFSVVEMNSGERHFVFFPMKAILSDAESVFSIVCGENRANENERHTIEQQIMNLLVKLANCGDGQTIIETNTVFEKIDELCKNSGVIDNVKVESGKLKLHFIWRMVVDTDNQYSPMVLPPCIIEIDLRQLTIRGTAGEHPHILNDNSLCMGGTLTDLAQRCIANKDLLTLVGGLIQFANSRTSSDADGSGREPAFCIRRWLEYHYEAGIDWADTFEKAGITREKVKDTIEMRTGEDRFDGYTNFRNFIWSN